MTAATEGSASPPTSTPSPRSATRTTPAIDPAAVERIWQAARHWYQAGMHPAIQLCLRHNGKVVLNRAIGHGWGNGPDDPPDAEKVPVTTETPFCVYSAAKAITTTVVHMLVERGVFSLDDRVCDYLPSYTSHGKDRTTIRHVMTHSAGVPFPTGPRPDLKRMDDSEYAREMLGNLKPIYRPGLVHIYHALTWGPLVREIVSAATGKNIRDILANEILDPLGFRWTNYGVARSRRPAGGAESRDGQAVAGADRGGVPHRGRRHDAPDHPVLEHAAVPHRRGAVVQHRLDRRRAVPLRRDPAPRRRTRRGAHHAARDPARRDEGVPAAAAGSRDRTGAAALGHRIHAGLQAVRAVRAQCARRVRPHRAGRTSRSGRTPSAGSRSA